MKNRKDTTTAEDKYFLKFFPEYKEKEKSSIKVTEPVRGKKKRQEMKGYTCNECEGFFKACKGLLPINIIDKCSRHRYDETHPKTPDTPKGYWDLNFFEDVDE